MSTKQQSGGQLPSGQWQCVSRRQRSSNRDGCVVGVNEVAAISCVTLYASGRELRRERRLDRLDALEPMIRIQGEGVRGTAA